jgi:hypothetical protein
LPTASRSRVPRDRLVGGAEATLLDDKEARTAATALTRQHRVLQAILVPLGHRIMGYKTTHYELGRAAAE